MHQTLRLVCAHLGLVAGIAGLTPDDCPMFAARSMASGTYAGLLDWTNKAGIVKLQVEDTLRRVAALNHSMIPFRLFPVSQVHLAQYSNHDLIDIICPSNLQYFASMQLTLCN